MTKRIAVIDREVCKPTVCNHLCKRMCPVNRSGEDCITISQEDNKPLIDESLCIGCGICVNKCPVKAITVVNLPEELKESPIHRYGRNQFALYRLPVPSSRKVVGLVGQNGVGKSTAIKILSGELKPNMGDPGSEASFEELIERFRGSELQNYLTGLREGKVNLAYKPQNVDSIPGVFRGKARELLEKSGSPGKMEDVTKRLRLRGMLDKDVKSLSGGELQLLAIAATMMKEAGLYFFDEPSSYLDVQQRLRTAMEIRMLSEKAMVMVVEHDLAVADYLADNVHILYGRPATFGIISKPAGVRVGINTYLEGYLKEENVRFRDEEISFRKSAEDSMKSRVFMAFPAFEKRFQGFSLKTEAGEIRKGEIIGILGPNATGKTTFIKMLTGQVKPDKGKADRKMKLAYKPQRINLSEEDAEKNVRGFLAGEMKNSMSQSAKRIIHMLGIEKLLEKNMGSLSGGELQSVMIAAALGKEFDLLLMDEPTAFLDVEQRLRVSKLVRDIVEEREVAAFIVDHDLQMLDSMSDRMMVFEGQRGSEGRGRSPAGSRESMNIFLKRLGITFRRDPQTGRARANKPGSVLDREQKEKGEYYYLS